MWRRLSDAQWERVRVHLPTVKPSAQGGRPRADDRQCFEGILWDPLDRRAVERADASVRELDDVLAPAADLGREWRAACVVAGLSRRTERRSEATVGRVFRRR